MIKRESRLMAVRELAEKVVVITGASKGIGRAMAQRLAEDGARVALLARPSSALTEAGRDLGAAALPVACDVSDANQVRHAMANVAAHFGRLDILVNNAALCEPHLVAQTTDEKIRAEISVNLMGPIFCCREAIPHLQRSGNGHIVNVSSESVRMPFPYLAIYGATKGGLETFSAGLRSELRAQRIRVSVLRLGNVGGTNIIDAWPADVAAEYFAHIRESGHLAMVGSTCTPQSIAKALSDILRLPEDVNADLFEVRSR
jgi:NAD(P)-dependent dehydrogenase (short-subunit alcohol dehydrogenase family)